MPTLRTNTVRQLLYAAMSVADLDRELLNRCLEGKNRAWEDFVDRFLGLVLHVIDHTVSKRDIRLGIEQRNSICVNVFAALGHNDFRILREFRHRASLTTYLSVVVRRIVVRTLLNQGYPEAEAGYSRLAG